MPILEYANHTVPDLVKGYVPSFESRDPCLNAMKTQGKVNRNGGTKVQIRRLKGRHSDATLIDATNLSVSLNHVPSWGSLDGDWPRMIIPVILPHYDRNRMSSASDLKTWIDGNTRAALHYHYIAMQRRWYNGQGTGAYLALGSLNGGNSAGITSGFVNGAIYFDTPANQQTAGAQYLNQVRLNDTVNFTDNWHNQYATHTGIGTDFLDAAEEAKAFADSYQSDEFQDGGIELGILSIANKVKLGKEVRTNGGANAGGIVYRPEDLKNGNAHPSCIIAANIKWHDNRFFSDTAIGKTEPAYLLNPAGLQYWVNKNEDHKMTPFNDFLQTAGIDADIGFCIVECQLAVEGLVKQAGISQ